VQQADFGWIVVQLQAVFVLLGQAVEWAQLQAVRLMFALMLRLLQLRFNSSQTLN
jgi:hypothetical protein